VVPVVFGEDVKPIEELMVDVVRPVENAALLRAVGRLTPLAVETT